MSSNSMSASDSVFGHYVQQGHIWEPLLSESSPLFRAVVEDDARAVEADLGSDAATKVNQFYVLLYWGSRPNATTTEQTNTEDGGKPPVTVKQRTLLMIAAFHGSMRVLAMLAVNGADPGIVSPDGMTACELAISSRRPETATVVAYLRDAEQSLQVLRGQLDGSGKLNPAGLSLEALPAGGVDLSNPQMRGMWNIPAARQNGGDAFCPDSLPYSTQELTKPEYSTDEFRMFCFKILRCCRRYAHDWRACPFAHPTENARRRDPREFKYCSIPCPDYKQGFCIRGDSCPHAHGVFECWLHPSRFRTQLCKDGNKCRRPVCFFSHSLTELRSPTHTWTPTPEDLKNQPPAAPSDAAAAAAEVPPVEKKTVDVEVKPTETETDEKQTDLSHEETGKVTSPKKNGTQDAAVGATTGKKAPVPPPSGYAPRMSNAFARKHGLNPKDGPSVNFQKLSGRQSAESPATASAFDRRSQSFDSRIAPFGRASRQRRMKPANHSTLDSLNFSMNSLTLGGRHGSRHSFSEASFAPIHQGINPPPHHPRGLQHSISGEHLRSQSAILPDFAGSLDSSFGLLNTPPYGSGSFLGLSNYNMMNHSASGSFGPTRSFSVQDQIMNAEMNSDPPPPLGLGSDQASGGFVLNAADPALALNSADNAKT